MKAPALRHPEEQHANLDAHPLRPLQEHVTGDYTPVTDTDIRRATLELKAKKHPGPGGLPSKIYKDLPRLHVAPMRLTNLICKTGRFPTMVRRVHLAPLVKQVEDPHQVESRRPIALLRTTVEIIETVLYHRITHTVGPRFDRALYAYRRDRGAEMCLTEIMDSVHRALNRAP